MTTVDITIRNVDEELLRNFKAEAVRENKNFGEATSEAFRLWLEHKNQEIHKKKGKLTDIKPLHFKSGFKDLSKRVDEIVYERGR
ncbi:hypothetical protein HY988_06740 [Candidatus Micrarchaeota archaeon]|nr:hypothetical protein [Candidatus Micrarchaeota archaeon]